MVFIKNIIGIKIKLYLLLKTVSICKVLKLDKVDLILNIDY